MAASVKNQQQKYIKAIQATVKMIQAADDLGKLKHHLTSNQKAGLTFDYLATLPDRNGHMNKHWQRINSGRRTSFTYAAYLAYKAKAKLKHDLADLLRYGKANFGLQRLNLYRLTVNPRKVSSTYSDLNDVNRHIIPMVKATSAVAIVQMNMENAIEYGGQDVIYNDRHLHYIIATTSTISRRCRRSLKRSILRVCRHIYGYGVTTAKWTSCTVNGSRGRFIGYNTKGVGLFNPLKHGDDPSGQSEIEKIYTANAKTGNHAGVDVIADEINQSHNVHRCRFYVNHGNVMANAWRSSRDSFKQFIKNYNDPKAKAADASMSLFNYPKQKPRSTVKSRHHATTVEATRTFNGLNRYTGKPLQRIVKMTEAHNRATLAKSSVTMDHLTSDGQKSVTGQKLPIYDVIRRRRRAKMVSVINTT